MQRWVATFLIFLGMEVNAFTGCSQAVLEVAQPVAVDLITFEKVIDGSFKGLNWSKPEERYFVKLMQWLDGRDLWSGESFGYFDMIGAKFQELPEETRAALLAKFYRQYGEFEKDPSEALSKKRFVDLAINLMANDGLKMHHLIQDGKGVWSVYEEFLFFQTKLFGDSPVFGGYTSADVKKTVDLVQDWLKNRSLNNIEFKLAGSFPSGRARWDGTSDLDILVPQGWLDSLSESEKSGFLRELQDLLRKSNIRLVVDEFTPDAFESNFKASHPIFIGVSDSQKALYLNPAEYSGAAEGSYIVNRAPSLTYALD